MKILERLAIVAAALMLAAGFVSAHEGEGKYTTLNPPQLVPADGKIEAVEFFWYGCEQCYQLEPAIKAWVATAPKDVVFRRIPAVASERWIPMARMYYTFEAMGVLDRLHPQIFDAIHKERVRLDGKQARNQWLSRQGIDIARYEEIEKSFTVVTKVSQARGLSRAYRIEGVPTLAVHGKYVTFPPQPGGWRAGSLRGGRRADRIGAQEIGTVSGRHDSTYRSHAARRGDAGLLRSRDKGGGIGAPLGGGSAPSNPGVAPW